VVQGRPCWALLCVCRIMVLLPTHGRPRLLLLAPWLCCLFPHHHKVLCCFVTDEVPQCVTREPKNCRICMHVQVDSWFGVW
jgi:hypothetical protein